MTQMSSVFVPVEGSGESVTSRGEIASDEATLELSIKKESERARSSLAPSTSAAASHRPWIRDFSPRGHA